MGMFRLVTEDGPSFYELFVLQEELGSLVLRLKHFDGGSFHGWEEKTESVDFRLVAVEPGRLYLEGLTFVQEEDGGLTVYLAMKTKDGSFREVTFPYQRVREEGGARRHIW